MRGRSGEQPHDPLVKDAYWQVPASDYVPVGTGPEHPPLDDPDKVDSAWHDTVETLKCQAKETDAEREEVARRAKEFSDRVRRRCEQLGAQEPSGPAMPGNATNPGRTIGNGLSFRLASRVTRFFGRLAPERG